MFCARREYPRALAAVKMCRGQIAFLDENAPARPFRVALLSDDVLALSTITRRVSSPLAEGDRLAIAPKPAR